MNFIPVKSDILTAVMNIVQMSKWFCYKSDTKLLARGFPNPATYFYYFLPPFLFFFLTFIWHVARMGEGRGVYRILVGKPEGKRPLGRPRRRWEDNIKMDLQEVVGLVRTGWSWLRIGTGGGHL